MYSRNALILYYTGHVFQSFRLCQDTFYNISKQTESEILYRKSLGVQCKIVDDFPQLTYMIFPSNFQLNMSNPTPVSSLLLCLHPTIFSIHFKLSYNHYRIKFIKTLYKKKPYIMVFYFIKNEKKENFYIKYQYF